MEERPHRIAPALIGFALTSLAACLLVFGTGRLSLSNAATSSAGAGLDLTALPIGDGKVSTAGARRGYVFSCMSFNQNGPVVVGPWQHGSTWDATAKPTVDGSVAWPSSFKAKVRKAVVRLAGNGLPKHTTGRFPVQASDDAHQYDPNANSIAAHAISEKLSTKPKRAATPSCLPGGTIGIARSGAVFFNALDASGLDAAAHEIVDGCGGHPPPGGEYHYHALPGCIATGGEGRHSKLIGWALDGFPIYGPLGKGGQQLRNSDLDVCHGHAHKIAYAGGKRTLYHYHATMEYPYTLGCYRGTPAETTGGQDGPPAGGPPPTGPPPAP